MNFMKYLVLTPVAAKLLSNILSLCTKFSIMYHILTYSYILSIAKLLHNESYYQTHLLGPNERINACVIE